MSLRAVYERFLASPNPLSLTENATLKYITTLTTFANAGPIVKHLEAQSKNVVKKKGERVIGIVEGHNSLCMDIDTTLEFVSGGGAYLPGLENFVTDKTVTFPTIHTVHFDQEHKIQHIRICWDQGALLKQVDVIGSRGKNWPIFDGKDQARLILASGSTTNGATESARPAMRGKDTEEAAPTSRSMSPSKKYIKDPHASLALFENEAPDSAPRESQPAAVPPRLSAKPPPREYSELFAAGNKDLEEEQKRPDSPIKDLKTVIAPKGGAGQNFKPPRLFDEEDKADSLALYKSDPAKYNHFDLGDAIGTADTFQHHPPSASQVPMRPKTDKHVSQWDFIDFVTPDRRGQKIRSHDVRHFGWSDDEGAEAETPGRQPKKAQPRPDAETHFELQDDGTPVVRPAGRLKGSMITTASGLYENHVFDDGSDAGAGKGGEAPLKSITNNVGRRQEFDPHWEMADDSPASASNATEKVNKENKPLAGDRMKAVKMMGSSWESYDESPERERKAGEGTGKVKLLKKGLESHWGFGEEADEQQVKGNANVLQAAGGRKEEKKKGFWDF